MIPIESDAITLVPPVNEDVVAERKIIEGVEVVTFNSAQTAFDSQTKPNDSVIENL